MTMEIKFLIAMGDIQPPLHQQALLALKADIPDENTIITKNDKTDNQRRISDISLNQINNIPDLVYLFMVNKIDGYDANNSWVRNGQFGYDNVVVKITVILVKMVI